MPVTLGTALLTRVGALGKILLEANTYAEGECTDAYDAAIAAYTIEYQLAAPIAVAQGVAVASANAAAEHIRAAAVAMVNKMVSSNITVSDPNDIAVTMPELIRTMVADADSVAICTVTGSASAYGSNNGNGACVVSVLNPDGTTKRNVFAETGILKCTADSQTGGATEGSETFTYIGDAAVADVFSHLWPGGSGATATTNVVDSLITGENLLTNSSWDTSDTIGWTGWTITTGVFGTDVAANTTQYYRGTKSIKITGDGSTLSSITQQFATAAGTPSVLLPLTAYAVELRIRTDSAPASGVLRVELVDGTNTIVTDAAGTNNRLSVTCSGLTTTWVSYSAVFRTPRVLPSTLKLRIYLSTAVENTKTVYLDNLSMAPMDLLYPGGPLVKVFAGATKFIQDDYYTLTMANNRAGATFGATFQALFDRLFNMRELGLQLPDSGSPTIADTLITA